MWNRWILTIGVLAVLGGGVCAPVRAQAQGRCGDAERGIEQALQRIEAARQSMDGCSVPEARRLLDTALDNLKQAQAKARNGQCARAEVQARAAVAVAERAIELCREGDRHREILIRTLDRTEDEIRDCVDSIRDGGGAECERLMRAALDQQKKARSEFRADRLRVSLQLTLRARELCEQAMHCAEDGGDRGRDLVENALRRTGRFLEEASRLVEDSGADGNAADLLEQASRLQEQAWRTFRGARYPLALQLTRQARGLGAAALDDRQSSIAPEEVRGMIETTGRLLDRLTEAAAETDDDVADALLDRARRQLEDARRDLAADRPREAFLKVRASSSLALDAAARLGVGEGR